MAQKEGDGGKGEVREALREETSRTQGREEEEASEGTPRMLAEVTG